MDVLTLNLYHQTMDDRAYRGARFGRSKAGSHLLSLLSRGETRVLASAAPIGWYFLRRKGNIETTTPISCITSSTPFGKPWQEIPNWTRPLSEIG